ncbi:MAG: SDR family NAD(P)-dependent oxidoreductase [Desulfobacteraceae bacterium]|nr:SDR family NAD(P)-dependent oxidoreductase [Desulfobacteraceae bacterium]
MKDFQGKIAVITGAGTGMGRELACQLASEGCNLAICDVIVENMTETKSACEELASPDTLISAHECDVSEEAQVVAFRDAVKHKHETKHINLLFNNAGVGGAGSFLIDDRTEWDKTFGVDWFGVYYCTRAFMPLLLASMEGHIINVSSVNGFWACLGPVVPHTAYSSAKFAVKGFSEALVTDLRLNAPHVKVSVVMPGHIGTSIAINSYKLHGKPGPAEMTEEDLVKVREQIKRMGIPTEGLSDEQLKVAIQQQMDDFRDNAPLTAAQAATIILDGVRNEQWRILVGEDAQVLDRLVRESPEEAYETSFIERVQAEGQLSGIDLSEGLDSQSQSGGKLKE